MKLGFLTAPFEDTPLVDVAKWAASAGFETLEVACWPQADYAARRYAGTSHIDVVNLSDEAAREIVDQLAGMDLSISGLGYYPNPLDPDPEHREQVIGHLRSVIEAARKLGVPIVNTFIGADQHKNPDENWEEAQRVWPDIVKLAQDNGVRIGIEHCPMLFTYDEWPAGHNLAWSPRQWRRIIETWGGTVGMNFDPSHLIWQGLDAERWIGEFGEHIYYFQAQDLHIDQDAFYEAGGAMSNGMGWQVRRLPGLGSVDWGVVFRSLYRAGYDGPCIIEHEDRGFEGTDELLKRGFTIARDVLRPYCH